MQPSEAPSVTAQVAVTLAGFAGIVVVFRPESIHQSKARTRLQGQADGSMRLPEMTLSPREQLRALLLEKSVCHGEFTLASGAESDFYVDARVTTLDPRGARLVGEVGWQLAKETMARLGRHAKAIGGLTMGADPVSLSIGMAAQEEDPSTPLQVFTVRKKAKEHGRLKRIEGNFSAGDSVVVVDDVITTGGSTLQAIEAIEEAGGRVAFVMVLVDRQEGGRENIEKGGYNVVSIFTRADLADTSEVPARKTKAR